MYSQHNEEEIILRHFGDRVGRFLDIGAHDGKVCSNIYALVERGWSGVCVEGCPDSCAGLIRTHGDNPRVTIVNMVVSADHPGMTKFYASPDLLSTTHEGHRAQWLELGRYHAIYVMAFPLASILAAFPGPYEFVSIDTEGTSVDIMKTIPAHSLGVELMCVETGGQDAEIMAYCKSEGLRITERVGCNTFIGRA